MGSSLKGGSMQKIYLLFLSLFTGLFLFGCTSERAEIVLTESSGEELLVENSDSSSEPADAESALNGGSSFEETVPPAEAEPEVKSIFVYVCGAVNSPGVYELDEASRVTDAVDAAGGFSEDADRDYVNLAALLTDGVKLKIPTSAETSGQGSSEIESFDQPEDTSGAKEKLININSASVSELTALPGIGQSTAEKIVKYRDEHGGFKSKEDIMNVSGIKDKLFSRICDQITV